MLRVIPLSAMVARFKVDKGTANGA
jgi:hypothetical protein